ncbi:hypothetical protein [Streptomyces sp. NPDC059446]
MPEDGLTGSERTLLFHAEAGLAAGPGVHDPDFVLHTFTRPLPDG